MDSNTKSIECITPQKGQHVDPFILPLMVPFIVLNSFITAITNSMSMMQGNTLFGMGTTPSTTVVNLSYDDKGNIASIFERKW